MSPPEHINDALSYSTSVDFTADYLVVNLRNGRRLSVPLKWFPALQQATDANRRNWSLIGDGLGIHWPDLDEDLSISGLLALSHKREFRDAR